MMAFYELFMFLLLYTAPVCAFVFVYSLVNAITRSIQEAADGEKRNSGIMKFWAGLALSIIVWGLISAVYLSLYT